jgi:peptidoglycan/xylan/chitin deacetylase (PgdA/CDA1 family)
MYHDVVSEGRFDLSGFQSPGANIYKLDRADFRRHLGIIAEHFAQKCFTFTFDDGGVSALQAAEILEEFGCTGYFFITTDRIGTAGFLGEEQIRRLRRQGHRVGSHSCSHPLRMSRCAPDELDREWTGSIVKLERILGEPVRTASVPGGYHSREVAAAAARAGIRLLFTSEPVMSTRNVDGCEVAGRFAVQQDTPERWVASLAAGRAFPRVQRYLYWNVKKVLKALGGQSWLTARTRILERREVQMATKSKAASAGH